MAGKSTAPRRRSRASYRARGHRLDQPRARRGRRVRPGIRRGAAPGGGRPRGHRGHDRGPGRGTGGGARAGPPGRASGQRARSSRRLVGGDAEQGPGVSPAVDHDGAGAEAERLAPVAADAQPQGVEGLDVHPAPPAPPGRAGGGRWRSSRAAVAVKVSARMLAGATARAATRKAIRAARTAVLPEPGPAITTRGPSPASTTRRCWALRRDRSSVRCGAESSPAGVAGVSGCEPPAVPGAGPAAAGPRGPPGGQRTQSGRASRRWRPPTTSPARQRSAVPMALTST